MTVTPPRTGVTDTEIGGGVTVKATPLLGTLFTVTMTVALPIDRVAGTGTEMLVVVQLVALPAPIPPNVTVLDPWGIPKFVPVIVTVDPIGPEEGFRFVIVGATLPPPAALKAATAAPQLLLADSDAFAATLPAVPWI